MTRYEDREYAEKKEITALFANWLKDYTHEVIISVMEKRDEIINNEFAMNLLKELAEREAKEEIEFTYSIGSLLDHFDNHKEYNPHNHCMTHSKSYRDILHDMYI